MLNTTQVKDLVRTRFNVAGEVWLNKCYSNYTEIDDKRNMCFTAWELLTDAELKALEKEVGCKRVKQTGVYYIGRGYNAWAHYLRFIHVQYDK